MSDSFYRAFEDRYRGSRDLIKSRLRVYIPFISPLLQLYQTAQTIDLGCGRGEWLELLSEIGFNVYGVDLDEGMLAACKERGLNVRKEDALKALQELPDESIAIISAFHVVEHLPFNDVQTLIAESLRVLKPGGLLILETPNPENLVVGATNFYLDPSHERPIPSELLSFVVEYSGFQRNKVVRLQESPELHITSTIGVLNVLNGVSPDYAVIAQKGAEAEVLSSFDQSFHADYGISLAALAQRYDQQTESRIARIEAHTQQMKADLQDLFSRRVFRWLAQFANWPEVKRLGKQVEKSNSEVNRSLRTVAVDLTPILPGGENGGAKIFVLELLRRLAKMMPQTEFVLLTQAASHEELGALDRSNMRRLMVVGPVVTNSLRPRLKGIASRVLPHLPGRLRRVANRIGYRLNVALKRGGSRSLLRNMNADLLFCPFTAPSYYEHGVPTVCTIYDLQYKTYPEFFSAEDVAQRGRTFSDACRRATTLAAISEYSRASAITEGKLDPARIRTIHLRMAQRISPDIEPETDVLSRLGLTHNRYLIYPANFWKHKNHEMLFTAFGIACRAGLAKDIKLVCTGAPGARQEWLARSVQAMNLSDRILFAGYLPTAELTTLLSSSRGMIFPSLYEGFGLPVIEAMTAGVPVACSNTTSLPEVAADAAILFDPRVPTQIAQAIASLVDDEMLRAQVIRAGRQRAVEFSDADRMAREYCELFHDALNTNTNKQDNTLTGIYPDNWAGPCLNIQVAPAASGQTLEIEFSAPKWLPQHMLMVRASSDGESQGSPLKFSRGTNAILSLPIEAAGGSYEIEISPTFVPARSGHGDDQRELSAIVQRCVLLSADNECMDILPAKVPA